MLTEDVMMTCLTTSSTTNKVTDINIHTDVIDTDKGVLMQTCTHEGTERVCPRFKSS